MEKVSLPTKTKIAAWGMTIMGGILGSLGILIVFLALSIGGILEVVVSALIIGLTGLVVGIPLFILGIFILKNKKWAWVFAIIIQTVFIIYLISSNRLGLNPCGWTISLGERLVVCGVISLVFFSFLIFLILLFLDRKNFWKIAT